METSVRLMTEGDIDAVLRLQQQWSNEEITWGFVPDTREGIDSYLGSHAFVAEAGEELVGYALGKLEPVPTLAALPADAPYLEVVDLYVSSPFRSRGVGGLLLQALLDSAANIGVTNFTLTSGTKDIRRVISFYERYGFHMISVAMVGQRNA